MCRLIKANLSTGLVIAMMALAGVWHTRCLAVESTPAGRVIAFGPMLPSITIAPAKVIAYPEAQNPHRQAPFRVDSNAPSLWIDHRLVVFHSWENIWRASGQNLETLSADQITRFANPKLNYLWFWLESAIQVDQAVIFGYYHQEVPNVCPPRKDATNPGYPVLVKIGAMRSRDSGFTWEDFGTVIEGKDSEIKCKTDNPWYAGGAGDLNVFPDREANFYYFYYTNYSSDIEEQGLAVARLAARDRADPVGKVQRWYHGAWSEPGLGGHATPTFPAAADIYRKEGQTFWGPVIHWNTYLGKYVMILNRTIDAGWGTEGIYLSFSDDVSNPQSWSAPVKIVDRVEATRGDPSKPTWNGWSASLVGTGQGETDKQAAQTARLFIDGVSRWEVTFHKASAR